MKHGAYVFLFKGREDFFLSQGVGFCAGGCVFFGEGLNGALFVGFRIRFVENVFDNPGEAYSAST